MLNEVIAVYFEVLSHHLPTETLLPISVEHICA
jgi:hypothetical protein